MPDFLQYTRVAFKRFKAFESFTLNLQRMNVLVGPNNAGKSTVLAAFRILSEGLRKANRRRAELVAGPEGARYGYSVDFKALSVGDENIFFNYDDAKPASVTFSLTGNKKLVLYFPETRRCHLFADDPKKQIRSPKEFKSSFNCPIGFVPILGPVEQDEPLYKKDAARLALFNYQAARNFRNIWYHYPEHFDSFQCRLRETWPEMDIQKPEPDRSRDRTLIHMFCTEDRITREIGWVGSGFQVWCQMLTHLLKSKQSSIFLIDEPDIYLHSDLQRQLLSLLAGLGPAILIATHSTEIIAEASDGEIVLIDKKRRQSQRIQAPTQLSDVFSTLGSGLNPILTQLAKTRRVVFVEGKDFQILARFARKLGLTDLGYRAGFAVAPIEGFNPARARSLKKGIELALGTDVRVAVVLDRDFRSDAERDSIEARCGDFSELAIIHRCKEVENFLLVPAALDRAARRRVEERGQRTGHDGNYHDDSSTVLEAFADTKKSHVEAQSIASHRRFIRVELPKQDETTATRETIDSFESAWAAGVTRRLELVPGKEALKIVNQHFQSRYGVTVTAAGIIDAMRVDEVAAEMHALLKRLADFVAP